MAGYARRPGVPPLSRARSLVIPDGERPGGTAGPSPPGPGAAPDPPGRAPDFGYGKGKCTKQGPPGAQETHFGDDKLEDLAEANPFSFKEFLKTKNLGLSGEDTANNRVYSKEPTRHPLGLGCISPTPQTMGYGLEYQQPFFEDPTGAGDLLDEDEDEDEDEGWNGAYLPSSVEQTRSLGGAASTSPCSTYVSFFSTPSELVGPETLPPWTLSDSDSRASPAGSPSADFAAPGESLGDRHLRTLQISYEALKDENSKLRRKLTEVQSFSETQTEMVRTLERKLEAKMIKEESDYRDLESVVQQVEQNLELMTKRAVKAENHILKLKQEISLLQVIERQGYKPGRPPQQREPLYSGRAGFGPPPPPPTTTSSERSSPVVLAPCFLLTERVVGICCVIWDSTDADPNFSFLWRSAEDRLKDRTGPCPLRAPSAERGFCGG
uniref:endosome-associated-trafficking regulator 1 isoform X2 n=1 Tax=Panthera onca TaxID=9690 RepID=UPI0029548670|nr:endosome-associated-trafficking regulator 1 isoform X2 [Panthera onca]